MKPMAQSNRRRKLVLLIEDEQGIRTLVAEVCRSEGYEVIEAGAGRPGVQAAIANQPDVILLDWVLPDISGIEVCREVRRHGVACPVLMLTGNDDSTASADALSRGILAYVPKPFDLLQLEHLLSIAVSSRADATKPA